MFVNAIEKVSSFTRPIFTIARKYGNFDVTPDAMTLFFVNEEGWAVTCKHTAQVIIEAGKIERKYAEFKLKRDSLIAEHNLEFEAPGLITSHHCMPSIEEPLKVLEQEYKYSVKAPCQLKINFIDCVDKITTFDIKLHKEYDVALIHFHGFSKLGYKGHAVFAPSASAIKQGKFLCRLGYPFAEFKNFKYDAENDNAVWTHEGPASTPRFPMPGMVTRLIGANDKIGGIELSTPGYHGMDGAPLFDENGLIYGMYAGNTTLKLGHCVHMDIIKAFLAQEGVKFYEGNKPDGGISPGSAPGGSRLPLDPSLFTNGSGGMIN